MTVCINIQLVQDYAMNIYTYGKLMNWKNIPAKVTRSNHSERKKNEIRRRQQSNFNCCHRAKLWNHFYQARQCGYLIAVATTGTVTEETAACPII